MHVLRLLFSYVFFNVEINIMPEGICCCLQSCCVVKVVVVVGNVCFL